MRRRTFVAASVGGLVALIGAGVWSRMPVIPARPDPDPESALGWIAHRDGRFSLTLPRAEMGQNIATALKQVACSELGADWGAVDVVLHATAMPRVKPTVGSESVMLFAAPLAQACAALRDALAGGRTQGHVTVVPRPLGELRGLRRGGLIGASPELVQGREIVTGAPLYASDVRLPGMLYGRVLRAPVPVEDASRPLRWNLNAARAVPGFVAVVEDCGAPIGKAQGLGIVAARPGGLEVVEAVLQVKWEVDGLRSHPDIAASVDIDARLEHRPLPHVVLDGSPAAGPWDIDLRIDIPLASHGPIEPRAAVASWQDETLRVWTGTQDAFYIRDVLADAFGLAADAVVVQSCRIGGKTICTVEAGAAALSRATGAPVKVQWTRAQEFASGFHRPPSSHRIKARIAKGQITDWDHAQVSSHVMFTSAVVPGWLQLATDLAVGDGGVARGMAVPYRLGQARATYDAVRLPVHTGPWRGLGAGPNALAIESTVDEAAIAVGADPCAFRLAHLSDPTLAAVLRRVAEISGWGSVAGAPEGLRTGRGIACGTYKGSSHAAAVADVEVDPAGRVRVTRIWCVHDCGLIINPDQVRAQCEGNLVWSIGMVLTDDLTTADGRVTALTFLDAPIPRLSEVPPITIDLIETDRPPQGAGETAIVAGPAPSPTRSGPRRATGPGVFLYGRRTSHDGHKRCVVLPFGSAAPVAPSLLFRGLRGLTDTEQDFASAAMMRLVAAGLTRQGIRVPHAVPRGARVPLAGKRDILAAILSEHGPLAVLSIPDALPEMPPEPVVQALRAARDLPDLLDRWHRLERFSHGRHTIRAEPLCAGSLRLIHTTRTGGAPPTMAESLLVLGLLAMLVEMTGAVDVILREEAGTVWRRNGAWHDPGVSAGVGSVILAAAPATTRSQTTVPEPATDLVAMLRQRLAADPLHRWTLADLSAEMGTTPRTLQRRLTRQADSFSHMLSQARLQVAAEHLCRADGPGLAEVGFLAGFADQSHFTRIFSREVGITPAAYRADFGR
jgi:CO/xanthine dehydrogenase Mo-binding subunit/AraC-like DNA-binding protein